MDPFVPQKCVVDGTGSIFPVKLETRPIMPKVLACRVLSRELEKLSPGTSYDFFEPRCHMLRTPKFVEYVDSMLKDHRALICGDCGGLAEMSRARGASIPPAADCIELLLGGNRREPHVLYLTDGWLENFDQIFGLVRLPEGARESALRSILSSITNVVYISTGATGSREEEARELAELLGCEFSTVEGTLSGISSFLEDLD